MSAHQMRQVSCLQSIKKIFKIVSQNKKKPQISKRINTTNKIFFYDTPLMTVLRSRLNI